ncbi:MAG: site-2 protease family protein [Candidatus Margulisiibacteriota bacterium]
MFNMLFFVVMIAVILFAITVHEYAHGKVAELFGDPTPKMSGRLTLNPLAHIDPIGFLMLVIVRFGWAKPIPINLNYFKDPEKDMALVALAGPFANFSLAVLAALLFRVIPLPGSALGIFLSSIFEYAVWINIALGLFNLIPVPPLDGSRLLRALLPCEGQIFVDRMEPYGFFILIFLILFPGFSSALIYLISYFAAILI